MNSDKSEQAFGRRDAVLICDSLSQMAACSIPVAGLPLCTVQEVCAGLTSVVSVHTPFREGDGSWSRVNRSVLSYEFKPQT